MSKVKTKDIDFNLRYANIELFGSNIDSEIIVKNLRELYKYIDFKEGASVYPYSKAYRRILKLARAQAGRRSWIISKRQIANLIKVHYKEDMVYVKIPYAADYIFKAIFLILDEYKENGEDFPENIQNMFGLLRRDCFYKTQCDSYARVYKKGNMKIQESLQYDLNSENGVLAKKV